MSGSADCDGKLVRSMENKDVLGDEKRVTKCGVGLGLFYLDEICRQMI